MERDSAARHMPDVCLRRMVCMSTRLCTLAVLPAAQLAYPALPGRRISCRASPGGQVYQYGSLYRMNADGTGMQLMASGAWWLSSPPAAQPACRLAAEDVLARWIGRFTLPTVRVWCMPTCGCCQRW